MHANRAGSVRYRAHTVGVGEDWEREAENWIRWARAPDHDVYWYYRDAFFDDIVPAAGRRTLELGCGEGRVARDLTGRGHRVTGVDASPTMVRAAAAADPSGRYLVGDAAACPFPPEAFDVVVAYNSLMDVRDMPGTLREAGRMLEPGGALCISVTHPLTDAGRFDTAEPGAPFVIRDSYLGRRRFEGTFERDGYRITFRGWCYPLQDYADALERAGFVIERIREPAASDASMARFGPGEQRWRRIPLFLHILARRR
jgi:SAM-dependent methyltransferase